MQCVLEAFGPSADVEETRGHEGKEQRIFKLTIESLFWYIHPSSSYLTAPNFMAAVNVPGLEGLDGIFTEVSSGGEGFEWVTIDQRKVYTNAFIVKDGNVSISESRHFYVKPDTDQFL